MKDYLKIKELIIKSDSILIGAGAGLSTSAGINYGSKNFKEEFPELVSKYRFKDMYTSSFYDFKTEEEKWSYWTKHINYLCLSKNATDTYLKLFNLIKNKNYFVITTNVDEQFIKSGFSKDRVFEVQGSLTKIQCSKKCHNKVYDASNLIKEISKEDKNCKIPSRLIPICPRCGSPMEVNLRKDELFVEDTHWHKMRSRYEKFIKANMDKNLLLLELGVGFNTPNIIRFPFEALTYTYENVHLIRINNQYIECTNEIKKKYIGLKMDINEFLNELEKEIKN